MRKRRNLGRCHATIFFPALFKGLCGLGSVASHERLEGAHNRGSRFEAEKIDFPNRIMTAAGRDEEQPEGARPSYGPLFGPEQLIVRGRSLTACNSGGGGGGRDRLSAVQPTTVLTLRRLKGAL